MTSTNNLIENDPDLVVDLARFAEGLFSERDVRKRHHLDDAIGKSSVTMMHSSPLSRPRSCVEFAMAAPNGNVPSSSLRKHHGS
jgi:hypothetical protein